MKFQGNTNYDHGSAQRIGVLVTNLGTPDAPDTPSLRRYLKQFLSDPRVVEVPRLIWWLILNGIILRVRPRKSAEAYASVWTAEGSPLLLHTQAQADALREALVAKWGDAIRVDFAMRYGSPSVAEKLQAMQDAGVDRLLVLPLYPQYSGATTGSTFDALAEDLVRRRWVPGLRLVGSYHDDPGYLDALAASIQAHWQTHGQPDRLLFSYHGVPLRYLHAGDPYHCQCLKTSRLVAERLGLPADVYQTTFQSRFGREAWLQPYTDETLKSLPAQGVRHVQVVCPGFSADCLETLEEIAVENRDYFIEAGGQTYSYIPALNSSEDHIRALLAIVERELSGWAPADNSEAVRSARAEAARTCPHNRPA